MIASFVMSELRIDNPYTGEDTVVAATSGHEIEAMLTGANATEKRWRTTTLADRITLCEAALGAMVGEADGIAADISKMMGKPLTQARGEVNGMADRARTMMRLAPEALADVPLPPKEKFERRVVKEPLGVVLDMPAWNYPLLTAVNAVFPAVLAGNSVIIRHSPRSLLCGEHFARAFRTAGAPEHLVQAVMCDHEAAERLVGDPRVDHVVFTGSTFGGHRIQLAAKDRFMHPALELGGNDPAYVAADADLDKAVDNLVDGACYNAGQSCCAVERIYVHASLYEAFLEKAKGLVDAYVMGDPFDAKTSLGPIAQPHHVGELEALVADATGKGARLITGGKRVSLNHKGRFFEATLLGNCNHEMNIFRGESFGPIVAVMKVDSDGVALEKMNDSSLGLTASVWTADRDRAARFATALECGTVYMNRCDSLDPELPWGGVKNSGRGVSLSVLGFDALTRPKSIHFRLAF